MVVNPILVIAFSLFWAFVIPLIGILSKKLTKFVPLVATLINFLILLSLIGAVKQGPVVVITAHFKPPLTINLTVDGFSLLFALLIQGMGVWLSLNYLFQPLKDYRFYMLFLLNLLGATGVVLTGDLFNSFVFLEILEISAFGLVAIGKDKKALEGAFKYMVIGSIGSALYLLGVVFLYFHYHTLNIADLARHVNADGNFLKFVSLLFLIGIGVEIELFPLNAWAPDSYHGALDEVSVQMASIISKAGVYLAARIFYYFFHVQLSQLLLILGLITFAIAELIAMRQENVKRMLAYSSIGQMGLLAAVLGLASSVAYDGLIYVFIAVIFLAFNHAFSKTLLFLSLKGLSKDGNYTLSALEGAGRRNPFFGMLFSIGALSVLGVPLFFGFWAKLMAVIAFFKAHLFYVLIFLLMVAVVEAFYYMRTLTVIFKRTDKETGSKSSLPSAILLLIVAILVLYLGIAPKGFFKLSHSSAQHFVEVQEYIGAVIRR